MSEIPPTRPLRGKASASRGPAPWSHRRRDSPASRLLVFLLIVLGVLATTSSRGLAAGSSQRTASPRPAPASLPPSPSRRSPSFRRAWRLLALALIGLGTLALIDAGVTLVWQEPLSALYATYRQDHLTGALRRIERSPPTAGERRTLASLPNERTRMAFLADELEHHAPNGSAVGRIVIPRIGASFVIVKGTGTEELKGGPGVYPQTSFPGLAGTTAIAGHRTTYLAPFRHIDALHYGNRILINMPYAHLTYTVIGHQVVAPTDFSAAVRNVGYPRIVLSACTPLFSAAKRLLVFARLSLTVPVGAARAVPGGGAVRPIETPPPGAPERGAPRTRSSPPVLESLQPHVLSPAI
jgi:sortase A